MQRGGQSRQDAAAGAQSEARAMRGADERATWPPLGTHLRLHLLALHTAGRRCLEHRRVSGTATGSKEAQGWRQPGGCTFFLVCPLPQVCW